MSPVSFKHLVHVGVGSNVEREYNIRSGVHALRERFKNVVMSTVYESAAVGFDGDPFYNLVVRFETELGIDALSVALRQIEDTHQRDRTLSNFGPRTLDIDLLLYDDVVLHQGKLQLPRDEIEKNAFVLRPLAELSGEIVHPLRDESLSAMWQQFDQARQPLTAVEFEW
ncbi:2-amino-4-hydroxy-6-hydroxymethyldihydropteridinepyrophosphokinase [hydrothermal vent metagenome]|uniref:2-amino-4-hydroxy-6-hydroxymethyldihydropteridine diphosphokinase n=1 Tax=hydrothermal vent metagenome TaxID=652676 RepID=A0A3B1A1Z1_9ZZZZ